MQREGITGPNTGTPHGHGVTAPAFSGGSSYIDTLLNDRQARIYEFLRPEYARGRLDARTAGLQNHWLFIWSMLSFEWWLRKFIG